jgi:hypothetical protein
MLIISGHKRVGIREEDHLYWKMKNCISELNIIYCEEDILLKKALLAHYCKIYNSSKSLRKPNYDIIVGS